MDTPIPRPMAGQGMGMNMNAIYTPSFMALGKSQKVTMRYYGSISMNPVAGLCQGYVFSANGLYDPDITSTGNQPYGFDQLMAFFDHYTVIGSRCIVECVNNQANAAFYAAVALRDNSTSYTGVPQNQVLMEGGMTRTLMAYLNGAPTASVQTIGFNAKKFFSKNDILGEETYQGTVTSNPADQAYFHVLMIPQNATDDLGPNVFNVTIDYIAVLTEPKILAPS